MEQTFEDFLRKEYSEENIQLEFYEWFSMLGFNDIRDLATKWLIKEIKYHETHNP